MRKFLSSFWWCLANATVCLWLLAVNLEAGDTVWSWLMASLIMYWVWAGKRALKAGKGGIIVDCAQPLTDDQKARIQVVSDKLYETMKEVDLELVKAAREKACVQSDKRKDQEAGSEGDD